MMVHLNIKIIFLVTLGILSSSQEKCTIKQYSEVSAVTRSCQSIVISNLTIPSKKTLELKLLTGTSLLFEGKILFEYAEWQGPLIILQGDNITVQGAPGSVLDGQGALYWDSFGGNGGKHKPKFIRIRANNSTIQDINLFNCPVHCVSISKSNNVKIKNWNINVSDGDKNNFTGHNTDGFDISSANNLVIENCVVRNQDDCVAINQGSNILISNMYCSGGHGLSLSVGKSDTDFESNFVSNVTFMDSVVHRSANGIHLKTHSDSGLGKITNITYKNIYLSDITNFGINVQQDYSNGEATGDPKGNIPITRFILNNVTGTMKSFRGSPTLAVNILCGTNGCYDWTWRNVFIEGAQNASSCNFTPEGYVC